MLIEFENNMKEPTIETRSNNRFSRRDFLKTAAASIGFIAGFDKLNNLIGEFNQIDYPLATINVPKIDTYLNKFGKVLNIPVENITPITITAGAKDFFFVSIPPVEKEDGSTTPEKLFMLLEERSQLHGSRQDHYVELTKITKEQGGQQVLSWVYLDTNINPRPSKSYQNPNPTVEDIITFPLMSPEQWTSNDPEIVLNKAMFFTPPSDMEWMVNWNGLYSRKTDLPFIIPLRGDNKNYARSEVLFKPIMYRESPKIPFDQMTDEQKLQAAPPIEGLSKGNVSTIKPELVIYRDENDKAQKVYNLLTKKDSTLLDAGIIEFDLTDGTKWEIRAFSPKIPNGADSETIENIEIATLQNVVDFIINDNVDWGNRGNDTIDNATQSEKEFIYKINKIPDEKPLGGFYLPSDETLKMSQMFGVEHKSVIYEGKELTLLVYITKDEDRKIIFINMPVNQVVSILQSDKIVFPQR